MSIRYKSCCSNSSSCCSENKNEKNESKKKLVIDFLYLDLNTCGRCQSAETNLDGAIQEVSEVLKSAGYDIIINKINVNNEELAYQYQLLSSPTIRINGRDITLDVRESICQECGDLCGVSVDCRVWIYEGKEYQDPPKEMIVDGILKAVYGSQSAQTVRNDVYQLPENLKKFYDGQKKDEK